MNKRETNKKIYMTDDLVTDADVQIDTEVKDVRSNSRESGLRGLMKHFEI